MCFLFPVVWEMRSAFTSEQSAYIISFPLPPPPNSSPPRVARLLTRRRLLRISQSIEKQTNSRHQTGRKKKVKRNKGVSRSRTKKNQTGASEKWTQSVTKNFKELFSHQISERKKKKPLWHTFLRFKNERPFYFVPSSLLHGENIRSKRIKKKKMKGTNKSAARRKNLKRKNKMRQHQLDERV